MTTGAKIQDAVKLALDLLPPSGVIGLGTGKTAGRFIRALAEVVRNGAKYVGVPTSEQSRVLAVEQGIRLLDDAGPWDIDVTVDGADEATPELALIKGGGACQLREKIVNASSRTNIILIQGSKLSRRLGEKWPVPVEVVAFGHAATARHLERIGRAVRREQDGVPRRTDSGNFTYDVHVGPVEVPADVDRALRAIPGVVETGLFVDRADILLVATPEGVQRYQRRL